MRIHQVMVIPGDYIGPEIVQATVDILQTLEHEREEFHLELEYHQAGAAYFRETGQPMSPASLERCRTVDAVLKGPVGDPAVRFPDGTEAGVLGGVLRNGLDLYANVRPVRLMPGIDAPIKVDPGQIDYVIVRENTEGLYLSRGMGVGNDRAMADTLLMTRHGVERVSRFAFELAKGRRGAPRDGAHRVTCVDKSNVLKSFAFFRRIFAEVGEEYPDIQKDYIYSDAAAQALIIEPDRFDVLVMENFLGDLLSDLGGATIGGIGLCPSGNYGDEFAYFEPIHGSAPSIAGKGVANPLSQVLSAVLMLDKLGEDGAARHLEKAVWHALESGSLAVGRDMCPVGGTAAATKAIAAAVKAAA